MSIKRYEKQYIKLRIISKEEEISMNKLISVKPYSAIDSLKASLIEVKKCRHSEKELSKLNSFSESKKLWDKWIEEAKESKS